MNTASLRRNSLPLYQVSASGFALVAAIFLLVVLTALGAFMLSVANVQQINLAQDIQGSRAYWVAKAGIQWSVAAIKDTGACASIFSYNFMLDGFTVSVNCLPNQYTEGTNNIKIYWVTATATSDGNVGNIGYTERVIHAFVEL